MLIIPIKEVIDISREKFSTKPGTEPLVLAHIPLHHPYKSIEFSTLLLFSKSRILMTYHNTPF